MDYRKVFKMVIELLTPVDRVLGQTLKFVLVDKEGKLQCEYNAITSKFMLDTDGNLGYEPLEWINNTNAVARSMKSGELELVMLGEHDSYRLKDYCTIAAPIKEDGGIVGYFAGLMRDSFNPSIGVGVFSAYVNFFSTVAANLAAQEHDTKQNKLLQAVMEAIPYGCIIIDKAGQVIFSNENAKLYSRLPSDKELGTNFLGSIGDRDLINDVMKNGQSIHDEEVVIAPIGDAPSFKAIRTAVPVKDEDGEVVAVVDMLRNMKNVTDLVNRMAGNNAQYHFEDIVYQSRAMQAVIEQAKYLSWNSHPVLIESESGTGKELLAQAIHNESPRRDGPFVVLDCSSIAKELAESEIFGYAPGAFTGALKNGKMGKVELASGGTLFLDEIGELPLTIQVKLLRLLQSKTFNRVGDSVPVEANIRIIAATNRNLRDEISRGNFRLDLYYRLNVFSLSLPPLRKRKEDISILTNSFIEKYKKEFGYGKVTLDPGCMEKLCSYDWPGNVRELENKVIRALAVSNGKIMPEHFSLDEQGIYEGNDDEAGQLEKNENAAYLPKEYVEHALKTNINVTEAARKLNVSRQTMYNLMRKYEIIPNKRNDSITDPDVIRKALSEANGNKTRAAELLGISRKTLYAKLKEFGL